ncbi:MAG: hypothetical protein AcusKO_05360 [Acuticoccus sp.]
MTLPVQVNGKKRAEVTVPKDAVNDDIERAVLALDEVQRFLSGPPRKVIIVPKRIVNVVAYAGALARALSLVLAGCQVRPLYQDAATGGPLVADARPQGDRRRPGRQPPGRVRGKLRRADPAQRTALPVPGKWRPARR